MEILIKVLLAVIAAWLLKIAYVDYKTQYIYDYDMIGVFTVILIYQFINGKLTDAIIAGVFSAAVGFFIYISAYLIYKEEAFGLGDVYLLGNLGCFWSWPQILHFLYFSFLFAGIIGLIVLAFTKKRKHRIAFGPILNISVFLYHLCGSPNVYQIVRLLQ